MPNGLQSGISRAALAIVALSACVLLRAAADGAAASAGQATSIYKRWRNGPPTNPAFFPLGVWWQNPPLQLHSGTYPTIADAAAGMHLNMFLGLSAYTGSSNPWPERFGADDGELEIIRSHGLYVIGGIQTPYNEDTSSNSVASVLALAKSIGALANVIGYEAGDEPQCGGLMEQVPAIVGDLYNFDSTRMVDYNFGDWMTSPQYLTPECRTASFKALHAVSFGSFDLYPATNPWIRFPGSDFLSVSQDSLFMQGLATSAIVHDKRPGEPIWVYIESGGDNLAFSAQNNVFQANVSHGTATLTNASTYTRFTSSWIGLTVSGAGIPAGAKIVDITDSGHAVMSEAATATSGAPENIVVTGDASPSNTDCVAAVNLCVINGNQYRARPEQVNAEVWMSLINGANGIEYFCHDTTSDSFCMGDVSGGLPAHAAQANLTYINQTVLSFATILNAPTAALCSMQHINYTTGARWTTATCSDGLLTMRTDQDAVPGMALVKKFGGATYLFAQSDRRSPAGARFTYTLNGRGGASAVIVYDANSHYDPSHNETGKKIRLSQGGQFSDVLGDNHDHYQVKIYRIE